MSVESGGYHDYEIFRVYINYVNLNFPSSRGINVLVLDKNDLSEKGRSTFDTWADGNANDNFISYVDTFNDGDIFIVG